MLRYAWDQRYDDMGRYETHRYEHCHRCGNVGGYPGHGEDEQPVPDVAPEARSASPYLTAAESEVIEDWPFSGIALEAPSDAFITMIPDSHLRVMWATAPGATSYEVGLNGNFAKNVSGTEYHHASYAGQGGFVWFTVTAIGPIGNKSAPVQVDIYTQPMNEKYLGRGSTQVLTPHGWIILHDGRPVDGRCVDIARRAGLHF